MAETQNTASFKRAATQESAVSTSKLEDKSLLLAAQGDGAGCDNSATSQRARVPRHLREAGLEKGGEALLSGDGNGGCEMTDIKDDLENLIKRSRAARFKRIIEEMNTLFCYLNATDRPVRIAWIRTMLKIDPVPHVTLINSIIGRQGLQVIHAGDSLSLEEVGCNFEQKQPAKRFFSEVYDEKQGCNVMVPLSEEAIILEVLPWALAALREKNLKGCTSIESQIVDICTLILEGLSHDDQTTTN